MSFRHDTDSMYTYHFVIADLYIYASLKTGLKSLVVISLEFSSAFLKITLEFLDLNSNLPAVFFSNTQENWFTTCKIGEVLTAMSLGRGIQKT